MQAALDLAVLMLSRELSQGTSSTSQIGSKDTTYFTPHYNIDVPETAGIPRTIGSPGIRTIPDAAGRRWRGAKPCPYVEPLGLHTEPFVMERPCDRSRPEL